MTDETAATGGEAQEPSVADELQEAVKNVGNQLTGGERLIALGALLLVGVVWLIGALILDDYGIGHMPFLLAVGILAAMYFYYTAKEAPWHPLYGTIIKAAAWGIALIGVYAFIDNTVISSFRPNGSALFFEWVLYASAALCAVGAWQLRGDSR